MLCFCLNGVLLWQINLGQLWLITNNKVVMITTPGLNRIFAIYLLHQEGLTGLILPKFLAKYKKQICTDVKVWCDTCEILLQWTFIRFMSSFIWQQPSHCSVWWLCKQILNTFYFLFFILIISNWSDSTTFYSHSYR